MTLSRRTPFPSSDTVVVTDAGLETWLLFDRGIDLPAFAAYPLAATAEGKKLLTSTTSTTCASPRASTLASSSKRRRGAPIPTGRRRLAMIVAR
jgi:hypothetical protein